MKPAEPDPLLVHAGFLRRLARRLVRDESDREDLLQEAWATAYAARHCGEEPPHAPRRWLARVLRNRLANLHRERAHRTDREKRAARDEAIEDAAVGRGLEVQQGVLDAVRALGEPYRSAIYLRYYEDLAPKEIARRLGVKVATVDTRLLRGRKILREKLSHEFGGRDAWMASLLPLCPPSWNPLPSGASVGSLAGAGVLGMKLKIVLFVAAAATLMVAWQSTRELTPPAPVVRAEPGEEAPRLEPPRGGPLRESAQVVAGESEAPIPSSPTVGGTGPSAEVPIGATLRGVVLGVDGRPLPAARVRYRSTEAREDRTQVSDIIGRFEFVGLLSRGKVVVVDPGWLTVVEGALRDGALEGETTVVAAPAERWTFLIVDESGHGLEQARLRWSVPATLSAGIERSFESSIEVELEGRTGADGRLAMELPALPSAWLRVEKAGYERREHELLSPAPGGPTPELTLTLQALGQAEGIVRGRVVNSVGEGLEGALVELGRLGTRTDESGEFHFEPGLRPAFQGLDGVELNPRITAAYPGLLPVELEADLGPDGQPLWPREILLQLAETPLSVAGRVVDERGLPLANAVVFLPHTHLIGGRTTLEAEMRGVEEDGEFFLCERTGAEGRFEFHGLLDQCYTVAAYLEGSLIRGQVENVAAGTRGLEIRIDRGDYWREVHGRVQDRFGNPIEGVRVVPRMWTQSAAGPSGDWTTDVELEAVRTDEAGRFLLRNLPRQYVRASLDHPELMWAHDLSFATEGATGLDGDVLRECVFEVVSRRRFQVVLDDIHEADEYRILDQTGSELRAFAQSARNYNTSGHYLRLLEGRSRHLFVSDEATTLVLLRAGTEVRRETLQLVRGEESRLR